MNNRFFQIAKLAALKSEHRIKIGAVLVKNGKPVAIGFNKIGKTHPKAKWFIHAELDVLMGIAFNPENCDLYLYRINSLDMIGHCRPCIECQGQLRINGIRKAYYTIDWLSNGELKL
jgi:tRNA(Arg) A34 adenosine deaminase TadA